MLKSDPVRALGAMSGTSLDGVDAAVLFTDGVRIHGFGPGGYRPYSMAERAVLRAALGRWPGEPGVAEAAALVEAAHAELLAGFGDVALVGFHGQTLAHEPAGRGTHQAGDGAALAGVLGLPVVWDFRSADVALGGQGAPLAPFFHHACARHIGARAPLVFLNIGGVANVTWVDPACARPEDAGALPAFDNGPGNAPLDDLMAARRGLPRDEGGALALSGRCDEAALAQLLDSRWLARVPPKSLDRAGTRDLATVLAPMRDCDAAATLAALTAACVAQGFAHFPAPPERVLVAGGGRHNGAIMGQLAARLNCPVAPVEAAGLDGDMFEAQAFAHLAVRVLRGLPTSGPSTTGVAAAVGGGWISRPDGARAAVGGDSPP